MGRQKLTTQQKWKKSFNGKPRSANERFWEKVDIRGEDECWNWLGHIDKYGYGKFWNCLSHRFAWELINGKIPNDMYICHHCDNPSCVNPNHLFLGTQFDNMRDMIEKGRIYDRHGENNPKAKLSEDDVRKIYLLHDGGMSQYKIAKMFDVSQPNIKSIIHGETWNRIWKEYYGST